MPPAQAGGVSGVGAGFGGAFPPRILNIPVPQVGHLPLMALRPFFINSSTASTISFFALHLTQYPSAIKSPEKKTRLKRRVDVAIAYGSADESVNCENHTYVPVCPQSQILCVQRIAFQI